METNVSFQSLFRHQSISNFNPYSRTVFADLAACHTAAKGYHLSRCNDQQCGNIAHRYHSCGNRHCPNCGSMKRDAWIESRMDELLPTAYYHIVFTLPHELNPVFMGNRAKLFDLLFLAASQTLLKHARMPEYLGAEPGITMVLHTWGQDLSFHPHVHCIVSAGGYDGKRWIEAKRKNNRFLFPQKSMAGMFKAIFMEGLEKDSSIGWIGSKNSLLKAIRFKKWNVYAKAPFGSPDRVVEYLGRYTHKIAITRHRILEVSASHIKFRYKDYSDGSKTKQMLLTHQEFLRRFEKHILPKRFVKIRHFGYLMLQGKTERMAIIKSSLDMQPAKPKVIIPFKIRMLEKYGRDIFKCPCCDHGRMETIFDTRDRSARKQKSFKPNPTSS
ncbi:IS91 family transposase [Belliella sp. DSM 111904]|uniref:IS91 family transposase n=1 Tax=Belliella filtrata TaxID=2923435 RepID=A0ABS9V2M8_9BACT|nr:IS91 family transposase [Belliella filtrata]MCH7410682.1 IS91 family transposase [Belliella filtrata]